MKRIILLSVVSIVVLTSCKTMQPRQEPTILMSSDAKIQYYQEQINRYQYLIQQEQKKLDQKK